MIIPKHKICDICGQKVGENKRYLIIKSKNIASGYADEMFGVPDNRNYDICIDCMKEFANYLHSKLRGEEE